MVLVDPLDCFLVGFIFPSSLVVELVVSTSTLEVVVFPSTLELVVSPFALEPIVSLIVFQFDLESIIFPLAAVVFLPFVEVLHLSPSGEIMVERPLVSFFFIAKVDHLPRLQPSFCPFHFGFFAYLDFVQILGIQY